MKTILIVKTYCPECGKDTDHTSTERGTWETQTCTKCGNKKKYRIR